MPEGLRPARVRVRVRVEPRYVRWPRHSRVGALSCEGLRLGSVGGLGCSRMDSVCCVSRTCVTRQVEPRQVRHVLDVEAAIQSASIDVVEARPTRRDGC
jgi:hypothetical protein